MGILNKITGKETEETTEKKTAVASRKKKEETVVEASKAKTTKSDFASRILVRPIVSEKSTHAEADKKYSFYVTMDATKIDVKRAIKEVYGILPLKVNMIVGEGKAKRFGRMMGRRNDYKKAVVTIAKDKNLDIHEGV